MCLLSSVSFTSKRLQIFTMDYLQGPVGPRSVGAEHLVGAMTHPPPPPLATGLVCSANTNSPESTKFHNSIFSPLPINAAPCTVPPGAHAPLPPPLAEILCFILNYHPYSDMYLALTSNVIVIDSAESTKLLRCGMSFSPCTQSTVYAAAVLSV